MFKEKVNGRTTDHDISSLAYGQWGQKTKLNFKSNINEHYNKDFVMKELKKALKKCHDTAVGCDDIHYQFLKHLPFRSLDSLLGIFN